MTETSSATNTNSNRMFIFGVVGIVVIGLAVVAILATNRGDGEEVTASAAVAAALTADVEIVGEGLDPIPEDVRVTDASNDPAIGETAPTLNGSGFDGKDVVIEGDGSPKVIYFFAHWCEHCQKELPLIQEMIDDGKTPEGLKIYAVSTSATDQKGKFLPPQEWFESENFTGVVIRDDAETSAMNMFGGSSFPYAVYLDGENRVIARSAGNLQESVTEELWQKTAA